MRIGIDAPKSVSVHRSEIYDRIVNERRAENAIPGSVPNPTPTPAPKSDLYDQLVAKQGASDDERGSTIVKTTPAKTTTITVKKRRKVVL